MSTGPGRTKPHESRWRWVAVGAAVVAVVALALASIALLRSDSTPRTAVTPTAASPSPSASPSSTPATPSPTPTASGTEDAFPFQPLWPFRNAAEADEWRRDFHQGGHQPWHLDAAATALAFTRGYLGYTNVDRVTSTKVRGRQAWIGVGFAPPEDGADGTTSTAAALHLAKLGTGSDAPWEVVGTRDTTLTLDRPTYGSVVTSPLRVGGRVTGVDESLKVQVRHLRRGLIGETDGVPAGGQSSPWHDTVTFDAPSGSVLTVAVTTGGHVEDVERFAITGVRVS